MPFVGQWELLLLAAIVLLIFGSSRVPRIGRDLGRSFREMRQTIESIDPRTPLKELERPADDKDAAKPKPPDPPA
jgi:TatA/E family protein of Tat protein translocase